MGDRETRSGALLSAETCLPGCMSLVAGAVDVTGWLTLGGLFTAHVTGNIVVVAAALVQGRRPLASQTLAVPVFILVVIVADLIARRVGSLSRSGSLHLLSLQTALLGSAFLLSLLRRHEANANKHLLLAQAMLAVSAMATQNALLHLTRKRVPTTAVMTGNLVEATIAVLDLLHPSSRLLGQASWRATWPLLACFVLGCMVGAACVKLFTQWAWLIPASISLFYVLWFCAAGPEVSTQPSELPA